MNNADAYLSIDGADWVHVGHIDDPLGFDDDLPADFTGLGPLLMRTPTPLARAMAILAPHLRDQPLYRPNA
ncbi:hypothetical protein ACFWG0_26465 [Streptomyces yangpuensis]|uniref:hypothetical protein n=1 Tax=Streptomyces yangpuensis TaxID=1648182 RepID=UPI00364A8E1F